MKVTSDRKKYTQFELFRLRRRLPPRRRRIGTRIVSECVPGGNGITTWKGLNEPKYKELNPPNPLKELKIMILSP